jgi:hypothetical protein
MIRQLTTGPTQTMPLLCGVHWRERGALPRYR